MVVLCLPPLNLKFQQCHVLVVVKISSYSHKSPRTSFYMYIFCISFVDVEYHNVVKFAAEELCKCTLNAQSLWGHDVETHYAG
jgi:hypothetical protein